MELNGSHIGQLLNIKYKTTKSDGTPRANAREQDVWVVPGTLTHTKAGNVTFDYYNWYSERPTKTKSGGWRGKRAPARFIPYHAEVTVHWQEA